MVTVMETSHEGGVSALALTPRTTFETRTPAQKRGSRPWLGPVLIAASITVTIRRHIKNYKYLNSTFKSFHPYEANS